MQSPHPIHSDAIAFGDGTHPTTQGVLAALAGIDPALFTPRIALDMGCGTGIAALQIHRHFACPVVAVDVAANALRTTMANATEQGVANAIHPIHSDGFRHPEITARAPFDLMVINILAEPILAMASDAEHHLCTGGVLILGGILQWQEETLHAAYQSLGMEHTARLRSGDWVTMLWQKP